MIDKETVELKLSIIKQWLEENNIKVIAIGSTTLAVGDLRDLYITAFNQTDEVSIAFPHTVNNPQSAAMHMADPEVFNKLLRIIKAHNTLQV